MAAPNKPSLDTLDEIFRFAVRRFRAARLAYGHGTTNARDEAAFLVLEALRLPIDRLDPYLDLRPTRGRARAIADLDRRARQPAPARALSGGRGLHAWRALPCRSPRADPALLHRRHAGRRRPADRRCGQDQARARSLHRLRLPGDPGGAYLPARAHRCGGPVGRRAGAGAAQRGEPSAGRSHRAPSRRSLRAAARQAL